MAKTSSRKRKNKPVAPDSDEHFASIAGYTAGGAPYGVTWEEFEASEARAATPPSEPPQLPASPVSLNAIVQEMELVSDMVSVYLKRSSGEFIPISDEYARIVDEDGPLDTRPDWEQETIRMTAEVLSHEGDGSYIPLPSHYDIHDYSIMERFCHTVDNPKIADNLFRAISGKGAFRKFKDAIRRYAIEEDWYRFKGEAYKEIARDWCKEHGITGLE